MNQTCKVCGEPAAGFHFGAFTCEGCKSFFGRSYNNLASISECKNNGKCVIDKKNRTTCKACRLRKCYTVGMSKGGSRYGRRSNWFKIHCLLQEQQQQAVEAAAAAGKSGSGTIGFNEITAATVAQQHLHHQRSSHFPTHMGGLLGYPGYLHEIMPFHSQANFIQQNRGNHDSAAITNGTNTLNDYPSSMPFFMMSSLPMSSSSHSTTAAAAAAAAAFHQIPPHLLYPGYHPAAAAVAADAYVRNELQKRCKSIDSSNDSNHHHHQTESISSVNSRPVSCESFKLSVDEDEISEKSTSLQDQNIQKQKRSNSVTLISSKSDEHTTISHTNKTPDDTNENTAAVLAEKIQSLSPVSICSISAETRSTQDEQDIPMDLSMKAQSSRSSTQSFNTTGEYDLNSEISEEDIRHQHPTLIPLRRKFYQINEQETSNSSFASSGSSKQDEIVKRKKLNETQNNFNNFGSGNNPTSMRGIFVCV